MRILHAQRRHLHHRCRGSATTLKSRVEDVFKLYMESTQRSAQTIRVCDLKAYLAQASQAPVLRLVEHRNRWKCLECEETVLEEGDESNCDQDCSYQCPPGVYKEDHPRRHFFYKPRDQARCKIWRTTQSLGNSKYITNLRVTDDEARVAAAEARVAATEASAAASARPDVQDGSTQTSHETDMARLQSQLQRTQAELRDARAERGKERELCKKRDAELKVLCEDVKRYKRYRDERDEYRRQRDEYKNMYKGLQNTLDMMPQPPQPLRTAGRQSLGNPSCESREYRQITL